VEDDGLPVEDDESTPPPPHPPNRNVHNTNSVANTRNDGYIMSTLAIFLFNQHGSYFTAAHH